MSQEVSTEEELINAIKSGVQSISLQKGGALDSIIGLLGNGDALAKLGAVLGPLSAFLPPDVKALIDKYGKPLLGKLAEYRVSGNTDNAVDLEKK
jgi:hypothetical protein